MKRTIIVGMLSVAALGLAVSMTVAGTTVVVTPAVPHGWQGGDVRPGGAYAIVPDPTSPYGGGALQLTTTDSNAAKAQYLHLEGSRLADVSAIGYSTRYMAGPPHAAASFQLLLDIDGGDLSTGFTTLVYEPYWNGSVDTSGAWQTWDAFTPGAQWWSSRTVSAGTCSLTAGAGGPPLYSIPALQTACPNAVVLAIGVNVGTYNPGYQVRVDGITFNGTTYDFELVNLPPDKDACKNGGWQSLTDDIGRPFKNQGQCVSFTVSRRP